MIAFVDYDDLRFSIGSETATVDADDDFAWGARLGLDIPIGGAGWSLHTAVSYIDTELDIGTDDGRDRLSFDPLLATVGIGYRF